MWVAALFRGPRLGGVYRASGQRSAIFATRFPTRRKAERSYSDSPRSSFWEKFRALTKRPFKGDHNPQ